jgi:predicted dehydrogenase
MDKIKVGIVGPGLIANAHVEAVRRLGFAEVVAVCGHDQLKTEKRAYELGVPKAFGNLNDLLFDHEIDVIHNCTPNRFHYQINKEIIKAGKHVLSEKPLAISSKESKELLDLAVHHKVVNAVNFNYRQYPIIQQLTSMMKNKEMGEVKLIHGSYLQDWMLYETDFDWRVDPKYGGQSRAVADIGSHWCDLVQYITGKKIIEVFADLSTVLAVRKQKVQASDSSLLIDEENSIYKEVKVETEDYGSILLRFNDGVKGVVTVSQVSAGRKNRLSFEINCSKDSASWNQEEPEKLWIGHRDRANETLLDDPKLFSKSSLSSVHYPGGHNEGWPDAMKNMMLNFYKFIYEKKDPLLDPTTFPTFKDGHSSMILLEAVMESHLTSRWVKVN